MVEDRENKPDLLVGTAVFATTHWSVVLAAGATNSPQAEAALGKLYRTLAQKLDYTNALLTLRTAKTKTGGEWPGIDGEIGYVHARQGATNQARQNIAE